MIFIYLHRCPLHDQKHGIASNVYIRGSRLRAATARPSPGEGFGLQLEPGHEKNSLKGLKRMTFLATLLSVLKIQIDSKLGNTFDLTRPRGLSRKPLLRPSLRCPPATARSELE